jgi:hypothetical protein
MNDDDDDEYNHEKLSTDLRNFPNLMDFIRLVSVIIRNGINEFELGEK